MSSFSCFNNLKALRSLLSNHHRSSRIAKSSNILNLDIRFERRWMNRLSVSKRVRSLSYFSWLHIRSCWFLFSLTHFWWYNYLLLRLKLFNLLRNWNFRSFFTSIVKCNGLSLRTFVLSFMNLEIIPILLLLLSQSRKLSSLLNFTQKSFLSFFLC